VDWSGRHRQAERRLIPNPLSQRQRLRIETTDMTSQFVEAVTEI
jgi:hypothetical protein